MISLYNSNHLAKSNKKRQICKKKHFSQSRYLLQCEMDVIQGKQEISRLWSTRRRSNQTIQHFLAISPNKRFYCNIDQSLLRFKKVQIFAWKSALVYRRHTFSFLLQDNRKIWWCWLPLSISSLHKSDIQIKVYTFSSGLHNNTVLNQIYGVFLWQLVTYNLRKWITR